MSVSPRSMRVWPAAWTPRWLSTCARVQPGRGDGARTCSSVTPATCASSRCCAADACSTNRRASASTSSRSLTVWISAARHLDPGTVLVDAWLAGEPEHLLAEDVLHDLGGAAFDRVRAGPQEHLAGRAGRVRERDARRPLERVLVADETIRAEQVDAQLRDRLVQVRERELRDRALGPGVAGCA